MWFKRKRKSDPDSALTETLRSLQTLLDDDAPGTLRIPPTLQNTGPDARRSPEESGSPVSAQIAQNAPEEIPDDTEASRIEGEQLVMEDYDFDLFEQAQKQRDDGAGRTGSSPLGTATDAAAGAQDSPDLAGLEVAEFYSYDADSLEYLPQRDGSDQAVGNPAGDTIPVLTDIVYEPPAFDTPAEATETEAARKAKIIDIYVAGLTQRLEHDGLAALDAGQQQRLRETLTSILNTKTIDPVG